MKTIVLILALCLLPSIFAAHLKRASTLTKGCCVTVYEHTQYQGASQTICQNTPDLGAWKNKISSYKSDCYITVYDQVNYGGASSKAYANSDLTTSCFGGWKYSKNQRYCNNPGNDSIKSIKLV